ncbi:MAG: peroxiredoxin-like family protein [Dongiaceae bacterium]
MTSLKAQLDQFREGWQARVGPDVAALVARDNEDVERHLRDRTAKVGATIPDVTLPDHLGKPTRLLDLLAGRPAIISFYRGGWCPYCSMELRAYQAALDQIHEAGGIFIAVSPERPDNALSTAEKNGLKFPVLSDVQGKFANALGLRFELSEAIVALYRKFGHDLPMHNGDDKWALPIPATFVVDRGGRIVLAHTNADYRARLEPDEAVRALRQIGTVAAAK